jgi:hypothetical protein
MRWPTCGGTGKARCDSYRASIFACTSAGKGADFFAAMSMCMTMISVTHESQPSEA